MSPNPYTSRLFHEALAGGAAAEDIPTAERRAELTEKIREALLLFGSETPDNVECARRIDYGLSPDGGNAGLRIAGSSIPLTDIAWALEDGPMPRSVRDAFPALTEDDWDAATRLITLILASFERRDPERAG